MPQEKKSLMTRQGIKSYHVGEGGESLTSQFYFYCQNLLKQMKEGGSSFLLIDKLKMVSWSILKDIFAKKDVSINETELSITLNNGAKIELKGADKPDSLRGVSTTMVVMDEYSYMKENVWGEIIQPTLAETKGNALFVGTPTGVQNHFYDLFVKGQSKGGDYKSWQFTTLDGGFISSEEVENAKKNLDKRTFEQEYLASFLTAANRAAYNFSRDIHCRVMDKSPKNVLGNRLWGSIIYDCYPNVREYCRRSLCI